MYLTPVHGTRYSIIDTFCIIFYMFCMILLLQQIYLFSLPPFLFVLLSFHHLTLFMHLPASHSLYWTLSILHICFLWLFSLSTYNKCSSFINKLIPPPPNYWNWLKGGGQNHKKVFCTCVCRHFLMGKIYPETFQN